MKEKDRIFKAMQYLAKVNPKKYKLRFFRDRYFYDSPRVDLLEWRRYKYHWGSSGKNDWYFLQSLYAYGGGSNEN